jgi:hypothetical protein
MHLPHLPPHTVAELLAAAGNAIDSQVSFELLRQAELREVTQAREFLLALNSWHICDASVAWQLRKVYNAGRPRDAKLWVPLTA